MIKLYEKFIRGRWLHLVLGMLIGGYLIFFFNLFYLGRLPLIDNIRFRQYPFLDPAANFIDQDNYIINLSPLKDYINKIDHRLGRIKSRFT